MDYEKIAAEIASQIPVSDPTIKDAFREMIERKLRKVRTDTIEECAKVCVVNGSSADYEIEMQSRFLAATIRALDVKP